MADASGGSAPHSNAARSAVTQFARDEAGVTAIEYCMIASFISIMIVTGATGIGQTLLGFFQGVMSGFH
ncbi:MAG: Flp family type IVb pilin [Alphaproteobacteria bacterium]|nr:Flp family type IVb pilin [Alphaproteobacteria bacterium]